MAKREGEIKLQGTRTGAPRKFADWTIRLPGGKSAMFTVCIESTDDTMFFVATSQHEWFRDLEVRNSDPNLLKEHLEAIGQQRINQDREDGWAAASVISLETERKRDKDYPRGWMTFRLNLEEIEYRPGDTVGNRGQTAYRTDWTRGILIQRGAEDKFEDPFTTTERVSINSPEATAYFNDPLRQESAKPMVRVVCPGDGSDTALLADTLERFFRGLEARMSPGRQSIEGTARPEELIEIMRASMPK